MAREVKRRRIARARRSVLVAGRFKGGPAAIMERINASIGVDKRLFREDLAGSRAHCRMLIKQGILGRNEGAKILKGLERIEREIERGRFRFEPALEDIHMNIEARLAALIGPAAGRLHTARSRNDQVATDFRLWVRSALDRLDGALKELQSALVAKAERHTATVMPGYTHLQPAQPVTLGHHLLAYVEMLGRDRGRIADARKRLNECPLGAAALAGTSFPIDRQFTARALGFDRPMANSIDAVSDRDFALEAMFAAVLAALHLSRLAEELVLWTSAEFAYVRLSDAFTTGSSIMPQKRNADGAELVRGKSGRAIGDLVALLVVMKGLPLSYAKDMQEDKEPTFDALETTTLAAQVMAGMILDMTVDERAFAQGAGAGYATATDLADWLVRKLKMPFREAHRSVGRIVRLAETKKLPLEGLSLADMQAIEPRITAEAFRVLGVARSVKSRTSLGGTAPRRVRAAAKAARRRFL
jgi:argininosuccinate lyase